MLQCPVCRKTRVEFFIGAAEYSLTCLDEKCQAVVTQPVENNTTHSFRNSLSHISPPKGEEHRDYEFN